MKLFEDSICKSCMNFEHECYDDYCAEWCNCEDESIRDGFFDDDKEILGCKYFRSFRK